MPNENVVFETPGPYVLEGNVIGSIGSHPPINLRGSSPTIRKTHYRGKDNVLINNTPLLFKLGPDESTVPVDRWSSEVNEENLRVMDPGFVDVDAFDFRLREDSPLRTRADELPAVRIDPKLIEDMHRFRKWVGARGVDGREAGD